MTPEHYQQVKQILETALDLSGEARRRHVNDISDSELRREVEELLALHDVGDGEMSTADLMAWRAMADETQADLRLSGSPGPHRIGPFRVIERLGRGGMGVVYLAEQSEPVERRVALKVIGSDVLDDRTLLRFQAERQALARLAHPNIAQLYEAGDASDGSPYFAMELVNGLPITAYCDRHRLGVRQRVELFASVCQGVAHAHQKGVLHRDLKPSNVLVARQDDGAVAKIIDFGIAKALDRPLIEKTLMTGRVIGTPSYMSPEAVVDKASVDTRSDVYSLGVILYELLVGVRPLDDLGDDPMRILSRIVDEEPKRPSNRWRALEEDTRQVSAASRGLAPAAVFEALDGDLDWVIMRAMAKEPARRYGSALELAADLERHLADEPVLARPPTLAYRSSRFARRHRVAVSAAALLLLTLVAGVIGTSLGLMRARDEAASAQRALAEAEAVSDYMVELFRLASPDQSLGEEVTARDLLSRGGELAAERFADQPLARARFLSTIGLSYQNLGLYASADEHYLQALEILTPRREQQPEAWSSAQVGSAWTHSQRGSYDLARTLYDEAIELLERHPEVPTSHRANALQSAGYVAMEQGEYDDAQRYLSAAADLYRLSGERPEASITVLDKLGVVALKQGDFESAARLHQSALDRAEAVYGSRHPVVGTTLINLSAALRHLGKPEEALRAAERSLAVRRALYGDEHDDVARSLINVAEIHQYLGRLDTAEPLYLEALEISIDVLGPNHPKIAPLYNNLAVISYQRGDYSETMWRMQRALDLRVGALGPDHPDVAKVRSNMGIILLEAERYQEAEAQLMAAQTVLEQRLGPDHDRTALNLEYLAVLYRATDRVGEAATALERALDSRQRTQSDDHPSLADVRDALGAVYLELGDLDRARPLILRARDARQASFDDEHPMRATSLESVASLQQATGELDAAERSARRALELRERVQGVDHPEIVDTLRMLGEIEQARGDLDAAEGSFRRALTIAEQRQVPPAALRLVVERMSSLLESRGRPVEARELLADHAELF